MTQLSGDETLTVTPVDRTKDFTGSSKTSEICWSGRRPDRITDILSSEGGGIMMPALEENTSHRRFSSRSNTGELLESQRRLHNGDDLSLSDRSQNCQLHIG